MNLIQLATAALILGETVFLYFGTRDKESEWLTPMNRAYINIDIIVVLVLAASGFNVIPTQKLILITSILIHLYRNVEAIQKQPDRYAFNTPLLIALNIRIVGLIASLWYG